MAIDTTAGFEADENISCTFYISKISEDKLLAQGLRGDASLTQNQKLQKILVEAVKRAGY